MIHILALLWLQGTLIYIVCAMLGAAWKSMTRKRRR